MTRIPKLYETPAEAREPNVADNLEPLRASRKESRDKLTRRRRRVAGILAAIALTPVLVKGFIDSYHYGYHPSKGGITHVDSHERNG